MSESMDFWINKKAFEWSIDANLVRAIIDKESSKNPHAIRYEPTWKYLFNVEEFAKKIHSSIATEKMGQSTSWGLMQVMGTVAREYGFMGWFPELHSYELGIGYGCQHFKRKMRENDGKVENALAAYNAGSVRFDSTGQFVNQSYVDDVLRFYEIHKKIGNS